MQRIHSISDRIPLFLRVVSLYLVPVLCIWSAYLVTPSDTSPVANVGPATLTAKDPFVTQKIISGEPVRLEIKRLGMALAVVDGSYDPSSQAWTLSDDKAQYATETIRPNDSHGTTFIYGHNTHAVFEPLQNLKIGDSLVVRTSNGRIFVYNYRNDEIIQPEDTSILKDQPREPQVVLITCSGLWSEQRRAMYFEFKEVA